MLTGKRVHLVARVSLLVAGYGALIVALTWPLASMLATHLPRPMGFSCDTYLAGWALAWQTHALTTHPAQFADANIYWPASLALFYSTPGFALLPLFAPLFLATANPTLALNGALLLAFVLTAATLHLVTVRWTGSAAAGIAAAMTFLVSRQALDCGLMPQYAALAPMPLIVWTVAENPLRGMATVGLAALIAFQSLTDVIYVGPPLFLTLGIAAVAMLCNARSAFRGRRVLIALGLAACMLAPVYAGYLAVRWANPDLRQQTVWLGIPVFDFFNPSWLPARGPLALDALALLPVALGLLASVTGRGGATPQRWQAWRYAGLFFVVGLAVSWVVPNLLPSFRVYVAERFARDLMRLGFGGLIGASLLAGLGFAACATVVRALLPSIPGQVAPWIMLAALMALRGPQAPWRPGAYPVAAAPVVGAEGQSLRTRRGPILVLPMAGNLAPEPHAIAMYRGIDNWRPLLNGYSSYYPREFKEHMALASRLPERAALEALRRSTGLETIVIESEPSTMMLQQPFLEAIRTGILPGVRVGYRDASVLVLELEPAERSPGS